LLQDLRRLEDAILSYDNAIFYKPDYPEPYNNRGVALADLGFHERSIESYEKAIALRPDYAEAHSNLSLVHLALGNYPVGFKEYEWRWKNVKLGLNMPAFSAPRWTGAEDLAGKKILVFSEQGYGDAIQFSRYAKVLSNKGAKVVLGIEKALAALFESLDGVDQLLVQGDPLPPIDFYIPMLSLPLALNETIESIPTQNSYLRCQVAKIEEWTRILGKKKKVRVGIAWSGSAEHRNDRNRSMSLEELMQGLPKNLEYVTLQKEIRAIDRQYLDENPEIRHFEDKILDFHDTAALCSLVDLVISVDTSVAHLAGALGRPLWVLLPSNQDWRWLTNREDSPWYPSAVLFKQKKLGDWLPVTQALADKLTVDFLSK
jgi:hypothetical protein